MEDEMIESTEGHSIDESGQDPGERSKHTPDSDEMNYFVLDLFEEFQRDQGQAITELELDIHDEGADNSEHSDMEQFVAMIKFSEKVPQMYRDMSIDELRHLIQKGLQSRKFVPIVPNALAGKSSGKGALSTIPIAVKPKAVKGPYRSWKESITQTGTHGHHEAFSRSVWATVSRNHKEAIPPFKEKVLVISPHVEASFAFADNDTGSGNLAKENTTLGAETDTAI